MWTDQQNSCYSSFHKNERFNRSIKMLGFSRINFDWSRLKEWDLTYNQDLIMNGSDSVFIVTFLFAGGLTASKIAWCIMGILKTISYLRLGKAIKAIKQIIERRHQEICKLKFWVKPYFPSCVIAIALNIIFKDHQILSLYSHSIL